MNQDVGMEKFLKNNCVGVLNVQMCKNQMIKNRKILILNV